MSVLGDKKMAANILAQTAKVPIISSLEWIVRW
jgi:hypothetical protein